MTEATCVYKADFVICTDHEGPIADACTIQMFNRPMYAKFDFACG